MDPLLPPPPYPALREESGVFEISRLTNEAAPPPAAELPGKAVEAQPDFDSILRACDDLDIIAVGIIYASILSAAIFVAVMVIEYLY